MSIVDVSLSVGDDAVGASLLGGNACGILGH
jgi:hypothetical protein